MGKKVIVPILVGSLFLIGCGNSFTDEVMRNDQNNQEMLKENKQRAAAKEKAQDKFYQDQAKALDQVVQENDLDSVTLMKSIDYVQKDRYQDADEFARYVGYILYGFYTSQITPDDYYVFLQKYGSERALKKLPTKQDAIAGLTSIQDMFKKQNITGDHYDLTYVTYNRLKTEGTFYRKLSTTNGNEYFITTIVRENDKWNYDEDSPSPPFTEATDTQQTGNTSTTN